MNKKSASTPNDTEMRRKAEAKLSARKKKAAHPSATEGETRRLLHELEVHQIELEMQNEELVRSRAEAEEIYRQYTDLYDFAPVGYFTLTRDGTIHEVNLAGANLLGVDRVNLINRRLGLFVSVESRAAFSAFLEKLLSGMGKETCELAILKNGNESFWVRTEATCFEGGQESRAVMVDITGRKQAEDALRRSEEYFKNLAQGLPDAVYTLELPTRKVAYFNQDAFLGYSRSELMAETSILSALHPEDAPVVLAKWKRIMNGETLAPLEYRVHNKAGAWEWVQSRWVVQGRNTEGSPTQIMIILTVITERKQSEEQLHLQNAALNAAANAIIITDRGGTIEWVNLAFTTLTGYSAAEAIGKNPRDLVKSDKQDAAVYKDLWATILAGEVWRGELINIRKDRSTYYEEQTITPLRDTRGEISHFIAVKQDITARRHVEEELKSLSIHDALTGLYNRGFFVEEMARLERGRNFPVSIVMADVDGLKKTNDQEGHAAGDILLQRVAQILTVSFRAEDVVARVGGDEFAVLLPATNATAAEVSLQRVRQVIDENNASHTGTPIHISLGVSTAEKSALLSTALKEADANMYREKQGYNDS